MVKFSKSSKYELRKTKGSGRRWKLKKTRIIILTRKRIFEQLPSYQKNRGVLTEFHGAKLMVRHGYKPEFIKKVFPSQSPERIKIEMRK